ncbi:Rhodanese-like protein [Tothia fuscella]|uniref:Rhodanese-like protein n=1 Tax=Tothia fuscella TaxID=1048955 RepID=A0A9P4NK42_9PEZI|nr:Rhodanese-like protein [Tothia fuscella]
MATTTIASLPRITASTLSTQLLDPTTSSKIAVVDVRDSDHVGGHIRGSIHAPANTLDYRTAELVRQLRGKETVVFHCSLSQVRGPSAALRYLRERERVEGLVKKDEGREAEGEGEGEGEGQVVQKVVVLDKGFVGWQETYAEDERLTEGYVKDIWEFGYQG